MNLHVRECSAPCHCRQRGRSSYRTSSSISLIRLSVRAAGRLESQACTLDSGSLHRKRYSLSRASIKYSARRTLFLAIKRFCDGWHFSYSLFGILRISIAHKRLRSTPCTCHSGCTPLVSICCGQTAAQSCFGDRIALISVELSRHDRHVGGVGIDGLYLPVHKSSNPFALKHLLNQ